MLKVLLFYEGKHMSLAVLFNLLLFCQPIRSDEQVAGCLRYMIECTQQGNNEENCVERMPEKFWPK